MSKLRRIYDDDSQYYFITCRTFGKKKIFKEESFIKILIKSIKYLQNKSYFKLYAWVILFDHLHLLLEIIGKKNISEVMHDFKSYTTNQISKLIMASRGVEASATVGRKYFKIWQTSFYDHIIRDERDLQAHLDYIHYNPKT